MKKLFYLSGIALLVITVLACNKISDKSKGPLFMAGIGTSKGCSVYCVNIDSGEVVNSTPIDGYVLGSTTFDPTTGGYGYVGTDSVFRLLDPQTGSLLSSIKMPGYLSLVTIDPGNNMLVGLYTVITYGPDPDSSGSKSSNTGPAIYTNYVLRASLTTDKIISEKVVDIGDGASLGCYYFNQAEGTYVLLRSDMSLIYINPSTGNVVKEVYVGQFLTNAIYNPENNTIISIPYSAVEDRNYVVVTNAGTGAELSRKIIDREDGYVFGVSGYDPVNNWYITQNSSLDIIFYDISTGATVKKFKPDNGLSEIKIWRK